MSNIFVSIASYRDPALLSTIDSAIENSVCPENIKFGIVLQDTDRESPNLKKYKNLSLIKMHPKEARGAGYARSKAMTLYNNEQYFLQIDSHTIFEKNWDYLAINELNKAKKIANNNKIILSHFPPPFHIENNKKISIINNNKEQPAYPTKQILKLNKNGKWTAERIEFDDKEKNNPELSKTVLGGFIFADGTIVDEIPYDPDISFFGEEICFAMRSWTRGWDIYSPSKIILRHFYFRQGYKKVWKDKNIRKISWNDIEKISEEKQKKVLCGIEQGIYGAGNIRSLKDFEKFVGINFKEYYDLTN